MVKNIYEVPRLPHRRMRAEALASEVFRVLHLHAPYPATDYEVAYEKAVRRALLEAFETAGVEILTDHIRQEAGLPSRGPDGWTIEEIIALEERRLAVMRQPLTHFVQTAASPGYPDS